MKTTESHSRIKPENYELRKRRPHKPQSNNLSKKNYFYVTKKTHVQSQAKKVIKCLENDSDEVKVHGLGSSLSRALVLALEVQKHFMGSMQFHITTSTVKVTDDLFPMSDECEIGQRNRPISAVHITFFPNRAS